MPNASRHVLSATSRASLLTDSSGGRGVLDVQAGAHSPRPPPAATSYLRYLTHSSVSLRQPAALLQGGTRSTYRL